MISMCKKHCRAVRLAPATIVLAAVLVGCSHKGKQSTTATTAPLTGSNLTSTGSGRSIYTGQCTVCHSAKKITNYSASQWQSILPGMAKNAGLTSSETQAVADYIASVLNGSSS